MDKAVLMSILLMVLVGCTTDPGDDRLESSEPGGEAANDPSVLETIEANPEYSRKLSPSTKLQLVELAPGDDPTVRALIQLNGNLNPDRRAQIEATSAAIHAATGDVVTISTSTRSLPQLAALDFIIYIELAHPLYPERDKGE